MQAYHDEEWGVPSHDDRHLFVNGTAVDWKPLDDGAPALRRLADDRRLSAHAAGALPAACVSLLHRWHCDGYLDPTAT